MALATIDTIIVEEDVASVIVIVLEEIELLDVEEPKIWEPLML